MANEEQVHIVFQGIDVWNKWREENRNKHKESSLSIEDYISSQKKINLSSTILPSNLVEVDFSDTDLQKSILEKANLTYAKLTNADIRNTKLREANLHGADLRNADLRNAHLFNADLTSTNLSGALFSNANLTKANFKSTDLRGASFQNAYFDEADLSEADLRDVNFFDASFCKAFLTKAKLCGADLRGADLSEANLENADLTGADLSGAILSETKLQNADLSEADLSGAMLSNANLEGAILKGAKLQGSNLIRANLSKANLTKADLRAAILVETNISKTILTSCSVYGLSAWNLIGTPESQSNLIITSPDEVSITVDDLQVAQFIYLLLNRENLRSVIQTLSSKAVLILGRFTPERKIILDTLAEKIRECCLLPIIFDFEKATSRDFTETIKIIAGLSLFVIVDITSPKSSPLELQATVPDYQIPFVPIIQENETPFSMFRDLIGKYDWVLQPISYKSAESLKAVFKSLILERAILKHKEIQLKRTQAFDTLSADEYLKKSIDQ